MHDGCTVSQTMNISPIAIYHMTVLLVGKTKFVKAVHLICTWVNSKTIEQILATAYGITNRN